MQLSRNFSLQELIKSDTAVRKGINNNPNAEQISGDILKKWRQLNLPIIHVRHSSKNPNSKLI